MANSVTVALAGNPNAGKTSLFNALTGARRHVGNWPGVTVEKKEGTLRHAGREIHVVDLPGTYSLTAFSTEEIIARNFIVESGPDVVLDVVDASNIERNLYLATQLLEMGVKVVIALNMMDVAESRGIVIDLRRLSELLGVPVVPTNAKREVGIQELLDAVVETVDKPIPRVRRMFLQYGTEVEEELEKIEQLLLETPRKNPGFRRRWLAMKLLEGDAECTKILTQSVGDHPVFRQVRESRGHLAAIFDDSPEILLADARYGFVSGAVRETVREEIRDRVDTSETIDKVLTNRLFGPMILLGVMYLVYMFVFQGSEPLVLWLERFFSWFGDQVSSVLPEGLIQSLVVSGIIDGVGGVLGFTPLIAFMFLAIAFLEDTGYMARIAFMLDRVLRGFGLHGSSMLALMVSGGIAGGCAVPGIMATRTLKEPKERLVTILVAPLMNCGAKLPVYALLIGAFFSGKKAGMMFLLTIISWTMALFAARLIRATVLSGPSAPFVLELPPYRVPTMKALLIHTWERTWMYVKKAGTVILAVSIVLWAMMTFPGLNAEQKRQFEERDAKLVAVFLADPAVSPVFTSKKDLETFERVRTALQEGNQSALAAARPEFLALAKALSKKDAAENVQQSGSDDALSRGVEAYTALEQGKLSLENERRREHLKGTVGGRLGVALEWVFMPIGFDWRTNIALVGGFAAKEVVVATLGTAYSLGDIDPAGGERLSDRLKKEPGWNPLMAFTLIMFVMMYAPCVVTLAVIKKETGSWKWTVFATAYTTALAYTVALIVHTVGSLLGLGVS